MSVYQYENGVFPFSADPPHNGHKIPIYHALKFCRRLVVLVLSNEGKHHAFSLEKRVELTELLLGDMPERDRIEIRHSDGLMCDEFLRLGCDVLVRGVRDERDKAYEAEYIAKQALLFPWFAGMPVVAISARGERYPIPSTIMKEDESKYISSTVIKAAIQAHLPVDAFAPIFTQQGLEESLNKQFKLGVSGKIACGKSTVVAQTKDYFWRHFGIRVYSIAIDELVREIYAEISVGSHKLRLKLAERFGEQVLNSDGTDVDRVYLKTRLFGSPEADENRRWVEEITRPHVQRLYHDKLRAIRREDPRSVLQLILLEWAQPVPAGLGRWSNNNVLVVDAPKPEQWAAAENRGISAERLAATSAAQGTTADLIQALKQSAVRDRSGTVLTFNNRWLSSPETIKVDYARLANDIFSLFPGLKSMK